MTIGEKIARRLVEKSWSKLQFARAAGLRPRNISRLVSGGDTSASLGLRIAQALGVPCEWLFDGSQGWPPPPTVDSSPIAIYPWPPHGITWAEVQAAISNYLNHRVALQLAALDDPNQQTNHPENTGESHAKDGQTSRQPPDQEASNHAPQTSTATGKARH